MTDEQIEEWWEERAAIRQFDGGLDRRRAEYLAAIDAKRFAGRITDHILRRIGIENGKKD